MEWLDTFLSQEKDGSFPLADKLIEVAEIYGFDGWFINQETEGTGGAAFNEGLCGSNAGVYQILQGKGTGASGDLL